MYKERNSMKRLILFLLMLFLFGGCYAILTPTGERPANLDNYLYYRIYLYNSDYIYPKYHQYNKHYVHYDIWKHNNWNKYNPQPKPPVYNDRKNDEIKLRNNGQRNDRRKR